MKMAVSNFQVDHQTKQSSCFPALLLVRRIGSINKMAIFQLADSAHRTCLGCNHNYIDEPSSNKTLQQKYETLLREFKDKKKLAQEEAKKQNGVTKRIKAPKLSQPHRQCHCSQLLCLTVGSNVGSSCPIECKKQDGSPFGVDISVNYACPVCSCRCS